MYREHGWKGLCVVKFECRVAMSNFVLVGGLTVQIEHGGSGYHPFSGGSHHFAYRRAFFFCGTESSWRLSVMLGKVKSCFGVEPEVKPRGFGGTA